MKTSRKTGVLLAVVALGLAGCSADSEPMPVATVTATAEAEVASDPTEEVVIYTGGISPNVLDTTEHAVAEGDCTMLEAGMHLVVGAEAQEFFDSENYTGLPGTTRIPTMAYMHDAMIRADCA